MKNLYFLLFLAIILVASSCKKDSPVAPKNTGPRKVTEAVNDSVSFVVDGKFYANPSDYTPFSFAFGNKGTDLKLSSTPGDWFLSGNNNMYWVGAADSVQYFSGFKTLLNNNSAGIEFSFIKNYRRANILYSGSFYVPNTYENFYALGDNKYAVDFGREGKEQGVAISLGTGGKSLTSFSQLWISDASTLTAESQQNSSFKITKIEAVKGTNNIIIEATFEANLFDKDEKPVKITNGFLRFTTLKYGNRF